MPIGKSLFDKTGAELAPKLMAKAKAKGVEIILPVDWACGQDFTNDQPIKMVTQAEGIPDGWEGMDCGPESMALFRTAVLASKTVIWNGPAGVFEFDNFAKGTHSLLMAVAETTANGNKGIIGGGDSATAAAKYNMEDKVVTPRKLPHHVSCYLRVCLPFCLRVCLPLCHYSVSLSLQSLSRSSISSVQYVSALRSVVACLHSCVRISVGLPRHRTAFVCLCVPAFTSARLAPA
jgi:hypothetical protein